MAVLTAVPHGLQVRPSLGHGRPPRPRIEPHACGSLPPADGSGMRKHAVALIAGRVSAGGADRQGV